LNAVMTAVAVGPVVGGHPCPPPTR
jgi:hypothetical protein